MNEYVEYPALIVNVMSGTFLAEVDREQFHLPRIRIHRIRRAARSYFEEILERYGFPSIYLASSPLANSEDLLSVHETRACGDNLNSEWVFLPLQALQSLEAGNQCVSILNAHIRGDAERGTFARFGWLDDLEARLGCGRLQYWKHHNAGIDFCLLSFKLQGRTVWFKAVGAPNQREYGITQYLSAHWPELLPQILAAWPEWSGWVSRSVPDKSLEGSTETTVGDAVRAIRALATLQIATIPHGRALLKLGAVDCSIETLRRDFRPFFEEASLAMKAQRSTKVAPMSQDQLDELHLKVDTACMDLQDCDLPDALVHGDFGHGNIVYHSEGPCFLDWAETYVGVPFLSLEYLLAGLARADGLTPGDSVLIRTIYWDQWKDLIPNDRVEALRQLGSPFTAMVYALLYWRNAAARNDSTTAWPIMRSLLRKANAEFEACEVTMR